MKALLLICLLTLSQLSYAQEGQLFASISDTDTDMLLTEPERMDSEVKPEASKINLKKFVNEYLTYKPNKYIYVGCNEQGQYYESDTVRMRRITDGYYPVWECCKFVEWSIVDDAQFLWSDLRTCKEDVSRSYFLSTNKVDVFMKDKSIYLDIFRNGAPLERFRLLDIEKSEKRNSNRVDSILVLVREDLP